MKEVHLGVMYTVLFTHDEGGVPLTDTEKCSKTGQTQSLYVFINILSSEQTNFLQGTDFYCSVYFQLSVNSVLQGGMHTMMQIHTNCNIVSYSQQS